MNRIPFLDLAVLNNPIMQEIEQALLRVARSGRYVGGTEVSALEKKLCRLTGAGYAVGVGNGLDALKLIMRSMIALGYLEHGDEVIVAANTYIASILAIEDAGLKPRLVEPNQTTMLLDAKGIESCTGKRIKAVMPVHLYGRVAWNADMVEAVKSRSLKVIEDNAQAIGARPVAAALSGNNNKAGALGDAGALSFYPTKNIGALGDAGAVLTDDENLAATVRAMSNYGSDRRYHNIYAGGVNSRLDPIQAAILNVKLNYLDSICCRRREVAGLYNRLIENSLIEIPSSTEIPEEHVWHQYVVKVPSEDYRDAFRRYMDANGIETDVHYAVPPHLQPCYIDRKWTDDGFPITCSLSGRIVSLPIATVTNEDVERIIETINRWDGI